MRVRFSLWLVGGVFAAVGADRAIAAEPMTPAQTAFVQELVRDYILQHPEVVRQALQSVEDPSRTKAADRIRDAVTRNRQALLEEDGSPAAGSPRADVTIVEFFDYRCGYCKQVETTLTTLLRDDPSLRIVQKMIPVLRVDSRQAAKVALAARGQTDFNRFHAALMATDTKLDGNSALTIAATSGLDVDRIRTELGSPGADQAIERNLALASALGIRGTPAFVIGDEIVFGAVDLATLKSKVAAVRRAGSAAAVPGDAGHGDWRG